MCGLFRGGNVNLQGCASGCGGGGGGGSDGGGGDIRGTSWLGYGGGGSDVESTIGFGLVWCMRERFGVKLNYVMKWK